MLKTTILAASAALLLTSCATQYSESETQALKERGIFDARKASKEEHLAYLQCYPLHGMEKTSCKRRIRKSEPRMSARHGEYRLPYDYEAEKQGFVQFLTDKYCICDGVNDGPKFIEKEKAYDVICNNGNHFLMRFDRRTNLWEVLD